MVICFASTIETKSTQTKSRSKRYLSKLPLQRVYDAITMNEWMSFSKSFELGVKLDFQLQVTSFESAYSTADP